MRALRILFTNNTLATRAGSELWTRDMALALRARGHEVAAYSTFLGDVARDLREGNVDVTDDIESVPWTPDIIHCHHHLEAMTALARFPRVPAIYVCHGAVPWQEEPPLHPNVRRWIAVDLPTRERLISAGIEAERIVTMHNFVDLARFAPREVLPLRPRRALVFSNQLTESNGFRAIRMGCDDEGIEVTLGGLASGRTVDKPEDFLGTFDVVFAKARAALEAMAVGCAVILCDVSGIGPYVRSEDLPHLRELNFGMRTLTQPVTADLVRDRLRSYDAADAVRVSRWIRDDAAMDRAVVRLENIYEESLAEGPVPADEGGRARALAQYIRAISMRLKYHDVVNQERDLLAARFRRLHPLRRLFSRRGEA